MDAGKRKLYLLALAYIGFISLGLPDAILGSAWPEMRHAFGKPLEFGGILLSLTTVISVFSSLSVGVVSRRMHTGAIVAVCCLLTACAMFGYAGSVHWYMLVGFTLLFGIGQGAVDSAINAFMARNYSSRHMNWCHCCWGMGATAGPLVMGLALASPFGWRGGYATIGAIQTCLAVLFLATLRFWRPVQPDTPQPPPVSDSSGTKKPRKVKRSNADRAACAGGVLFYFVYPGAEAMAGLWAASYLVDHMGASPSIAGMITAIFWASLTLGRFLAGVLAERLGNVTILRGGTCIAFVGAAIVLLSGSILGTAAGLVVSGLGLAPLYPTMMHDTPQRVGELFSDSQISFQVGAALAGAAVLPLLAGVIMREASLAAFGPVLLASIALVALSHEASLHAGRRSA